MPAHPYTPITCLSSAALQELLTGECDPHRRQRELVRASLLARPDAPAERRR